MPIFYTPEIETNGELPADEARHCIRVLRLKEGDSINLTDGVGNFYKAQITLTTSKRCLVEIQEKTTPTALPFKLHIAMGPTKNMDRNEWFAEKATEIGISEITFLNCRYSERRKLNIERVEKKIVSAMKQSQKATLPKLNDITSFEDFITQEFDGPKFIAHCYKQEKKLLKDLYKLGENALILIGPEGDFSEEEVELAIENNFTPISLGSSRLRTETAALFACNTINLLNQ